MDALASSSTLESRILRSVAGGKLDTVGAAIKKDGSHVSRIISGERGLRLCELEPFFKSIGMRVIDCDGQVVSLPAQEVASLRYLARKGIGE